MAEGDAVLSSLVNGGRGLGSCVEELLEGASVGLASREGLEQGR
jgi:hypothetical protein